MTGNSRAKAQEFSETISRIGEEWTEKVWPAKHLLVQDNFERLITLKLLDEGIGQLLAEAKLPAEPLVVFMDRGGGGDGTRAAASLIEYIGQKYSGASFVHVAFSTPPQGLGTLVRSSLVRAGAKHGVVVDVVAAERPISGLELSEYDAKYLLDGCDLVVTFAPGGSAGLMTESKSLGCLPLIERSHLSMLSFSDPESLVAQLSTLKTMVEKDAEMDSLRLWVQLLKPEGSEELGMSVLGGEGDAEDRFWMLLDNAKRSSYQIFLEPVRSGIACGTTLCYPCRTAIEQQLSGHSIVSRIVPAGERLAVVARGKALTN